MATIEEISDSLNSIRPYLMEDGGNVEVMEVSDEGVVKIRMKGNCKNCMQKESTIKSGIESLILEKFKELKSVEEVF